MSGGTPGTKRPKRKAPRRNLRRHQSEIPAHRVSDHYGGSTVHTLALARGVDWIYCQRFVCVRLAICEAGWLIRPCSDDDDYYDSVRRALSCRPDERPLGSLVGRAPSPFCRPRCSVNGEIAFVVAAAEENATSDRNWVAAASSRTRRRRRRRPSGIVVRSSLIGKVSTTTRYVACVNTAVKPSPRYRFRLGPLMLVRRLTHVVVITAIVNRITCSAARLCAVAKQNRKRSRKQTSTIRATERLWFAISAL